MSDRGKTALIIGATGQVGGKLLHELLKDPSFTRVGEYGRRVTPTESIQAGKEKLEQKNIDFEKVEEAGLKDGKWDVVFVTLGTTRAQAGSAVAFEKIDREYVINASRAARVEGRNQRLVYLSTGAADPHSHFLYLRSKGLTELGLAKLGFDETIVFQPGLLTDLHRSSPRFVESLLDRLVKLRSSWTYDWSCPIGKVAQAMLVAGRNGVDGLPEAAKPHTSTAGGDTPFTIVDNHGTWALADNFT